MLDPLRSLAELVRTLTRSRTASRGESAAASQRGAQGSATQQGAAAAPGELLRERLRAQLSSVGRGDPRRAREAFVATVLAAELGESVSLDPGFSDIVSKVARQLGEDANTSRDLARLFDELTRDPR